MKIEIAAFAWTAIVVALLTMYEWPKMKQSPKKDKIAFISIMLIGLFMTLFSLKQMAGPVTWLELIYRPLGKFMEQ